MEDNEVALYQYSLDELLRIVRELKSTEIKFDWHYHPPKWEIDVGGTPRHAVFKFADPKYTTWFELKYK